MAVPRLFSSQTHRLEQGLRLHCFFADLSGAAHQLIHLLEGGVLHLFRTCSEVAASCLSFQDPLNLCCVPVTAHCGRNTVSIQPACYRGHPKPF